MITADIENLLVNFLQALALTGVLITILGILFFVASVIAIILTTKTKTYHPENGEAFTVRIDAFGNHRIVDTPMKEKRKNDDLHFEKKKKRGEEVFRAAGDVDMLVIDDATIQSKETGLIANP